MNQTMQNLSIVFIGGGNMGQALVTGLLDNGWNADNIAIVDNDQAISTTLNEKFSHCHVYTQSEAALNLADVVVLAVKPQAMQTACEQIATQCQVKRPLIISIAAGILINSIDTWLGGELPIIRCMPNTPALVQAGVTGLFANPEVSIGQRELAYEILNSVGTALWIENESLLDAVTAVSGSGPAYFFYLIEAMMEAGQNLGLNEAQARELTVATATGAAKLISNSDKSAQALRHAVTSKGGTTEAAINTLQQHEMKKIIETAIQNAAKRSQQLSDTSK
ncbi:MAG: pyrroline-5-carboxylate reductase [Gammaproteobacteria bacterium]|nr:MAG: pyrroline-5-carboxylate reductase [Gammaproteobacteria bacterium]